MGHPLTAKAGGPRAIDRSGARVAWILSLHTGLLDHSSVN